MNEAASLHHVRRPKEAVRGQDIAAKIGLTGRGKDLNEFYQLIKKG